ncbi:MAG: hypothetical protein V1723_00605, partial [Candidatus Uhrbacteria bacterium]
PTRRTTVEANRETTISQALAKDAIGAQYRPIPNGGWKFAAGIIVALCTLGPMIGSLGIILRIIPADPTATLVRVIMAIGSIEGFFVFCWTFFPIFFPVIGRGYGDALLSPLLWLRDYYRQTVIGYHIIAYRPVDELRFIGPYANNAPWWKDSETFPRNTTWTELILPLGGWFARPRVVIGERYGERQTVEHAAPWRIQLVEWSPDNEVIVIRLTDSSGDRVTVSADRALEIIKRHASDSFANCAPRTWRTEVDYLFDQLGSRTRERDEAAALVKQLRGEILADMREHSHVLAEIAAERDAARKEIAQQRQERDRALLSLRTATDRIRESSRFVHSTEGLQLRIWLLEKLLKLLPTDDNQREAYVAELAKAQKVLAHRDVQKKGAKGAAA